MHLHPDSVLPLAQLECASAPRKPEMPVVATSMTGQLALTSNDETTLTALGKSLGSRDVQVEFEHDRS
jgi:hypothetical protein